MQISQKRNGTNGLRHGFDAWLHDNASSHTSLIVHKFLARNQVCVLNHPPYSHDLAPSNYSIHKIEIERMFF